MWTALPQAVKDLAMPIKFTVHHNINSTHFATTVSERCQSY